MLKNVLFFSVFNVSKWPFVIYYFKISMNISVPPEVHSDDEEEIEDVDDDEDDDDDDKYVIDPNMIPPQSPYQAVLASEPDLNKRPQKSALKKPNTPGATGEATFSGVHYVCRQMVSDRMKGCRCVSM